MSISDAFACSAIQLISANLFEGCAQGDNADARTNLALGSLMAGVAFSNAMVGIVHSIGHSLGGLAHVPHGQAMMILLPHCIDLNIALGINTALYAELLRVLDEDAYHNCSPEERAKAFAQAIHAMNRRLHDEFQVPISLKELGVKKEQFPEIAQQARYDGSALYNEGEVSIEAAMSICGIRTG